MRIVILGGTGLVGSYLKPQLERHGHNVKAYGREAFDPGFDLAAELNGLDCLIQLSGANIGQRWTAAHQKRIWTSRVDLNHHLAEVLRSLDEPPKRVIAASAIGFYPESDCDHPLDESHTDAGQNAFGDLVQAWEKATQKLAAPERLVTFRFGVVLTANGGALGKMLPAFKLGLGGPIAGGQQCFSWVHIDDLTQGFLLRSTIRRCTAPSTSPAHNRSRKPNSVSIGSPATPPFLVAGFPLATAVTARRRRTGADRQPSGGAHPIDESRIPFPIPNA